MTEDTKKVIQERKIPIINKTYILKEEARSKFEDGTLTLKLTNKTDPLRDIAIQLFFRPFLTFIINSGGRVFQQVLFKFIRTEYPNFKGREKKILDNMKEYNLVRVVKFTATTSNIVEVTTVTLDYFSKPHLPSFSSTRLWKGTYMSYLIIDDSQRMVRRVRFIKDKQRSLIITDDIFKKLEYRNIELLDFNDDGLLFVLFDTEQNFSPTYLKKIITETMVHIQKDYKLMVVTYNKDRQDIIEKVMNKTLEDSTIYSHGGYIRGLIVAQIDILKHFYPPASNTRKAN